MGVAIAILLFLILWAVAPELVQTLIGTALGLLVWAALILTILVLANA